MFSIFSWVVSSYFACNCVVLYFTIVSWRLRPLKAPNESLLSFFVFPSFFCTFSIFPITTVRLLYCCLFSPLLTNDEGMFSIFSWVVSSYFACNCVVLFFIVIFSWRLLPLKAPNESLLSFFLFSTFFCTFSILPITAVRLLYCCLFSPLLTNDGGMHHVHPFIISPRPFHLLHFSLWFYLCSWEDGGSTIHPASYSRLLFPRTSGASASSTSSAKQISLAANYQSAPCLVVLLMRLEITSKQTAVLSGISGQMPDVCAQRSRARDFQSKRNS